MYARIGVEALYTNAIPTGLILTSNNTSNGVFAKVEQGHSPYDTITISVNQTTFNQNDSALTLKIYARKHGTNACRVISSVEIMN